MLKIILHLPDHSNMYLRPHVPTPTVQQQQPTIFNTPYQPGPQNAMMTSNTPNVPVSHSWANPNPALSMETVTINQSAAMSNLPRPTSSRQQLAKHKSGYSHRAERTNFESNILPQLSMRDLQCLDAVPQTSEMSQSESQPLFHLQHQRNELPSETHAQNHPLNHSQGLQTVWPNFNTLNPNQNTFNGSVPGVGVGSQGLGSLSFLEGMEEEDFLKGLVGGGSQTGFQLKQEPQITVGQEVHTSLMQSPRESQGNTYTNLLPRPTSNGTHMDPMRQEATQPLKNLQNPYSNNGMVSEGHFPTLADWIKANRHCD